MDKNQVVQRIPVTQAITPVQERWLYEHGGRTKEHVLIQDTSLYILMKLAGGGYEKILLP
jgi:hypothetical protein